jgi:hypothetical protein
MQFIFDGVFKGSSHVSRNVEVARLLGDTLLLVVSTARVKIPTGLMAPEMQNRQTLIVSRDNDVWQIAHWHNTPIKESN